MYSYDPARGSTVWSHDHFCVVEVMDYDDSDVRGETVFIELPNGKMDTVHIDSLCPVQEEWESWAM